MNSNLSSINIIKEDLLNQSKDFTCYKFHKLIELQSLFIESLVQKIQFLYYDRNKLLAQNMQLKRVIERFEENQSIQFVIKTSTQKDSQLFQQINLQTQSFQQNIKNRLQSDYFQSRQPSAKKKDPYENLFRSNEEVPIFYKTNNKLSAKQGQQYMTSNHKKDHMVSNKMNSKNISNEKKKKMNMNLIRYGGTSQFKRTPILYQPQFKIHYYTSKPNLFGLIRSFYILIFAIPAYRSKIVETIQKLYIKDNQIYLLSSYPDNYFIGNIMKNFLLQKAAQMNHYDLIQCINRFTLYDTILCNIIKNQIYSYVKIDDQFNEDYIKRCFLSLGVIFSLEVIQKDNQYKFYEDIQDMDEYDGQVIKKKMVYQQISLNPKYRNQQGISQKDNEKKEFFSIKYNTQTRKFEFIIKEELSISNQSKYYRMNDQDNQNYQVNDNDDQCLQFYKSSSIKFTNNNRRFSKQSNHFIDIPSILSEDQPQIKQSRLLSQQSRQLFVSAMQRYYKSKQLSHQSSMLLSSYNNSKRQQTKNANKYTQTKVRGFRDRWNNSHLKSLTYSKNESSTRKGLEIEMEVEIERNKETNSIFNIIDEDQLN